mmetsp:Transcript_13456/g.34356  ORF Transcript_13456/g.34356 Transcript_13456/m.34356 type:complete len:345 (+) Transcript_13456:2084-3118(+)
MMDPVEVPQIRSKADARGLPSKLSDFSRPRSNCRATSPRVPPPSIDSIRTPRAPPLCDTAAWNSSGVSGSGAGATVPSAPPSAHASIAPSTPQTASSRKAASLSSLRAGAPRATVRIPSKWHACNQHRTAGSNARFPSANRAGTCSDAPPPPAPSPVHAQCTSNRRSSPKVASGGGAGCGEVLAPSPGDAKPATPAAGPHGGASPALLSLCEPLELPGALPDPQFAEPASAAGTANGATSEIPDGMAASISSSERCCTTRMHSARARATELFWMTCCRARCSNSPWLTARSPNSSSDSLIFARAEQRGGSHLAACRVIPRCTHASRIGACGLVASVRACLVELA